MSFRNYGILVVLLVFVVLGMLNGCQNRRASTHTIIADEPRLPHVQAGSNDAMILALEKRLKRLDIQVVSMGDNYLISIPAASLFGDQSPQFTWKSFAVLNEVACYLREFRKVSVEVSAYVSSYGSTRRQLSLSLARSKAVADYLWSQGIDSRFVFAHGHGREKPIVIKAKSNDNSPNARIEITFRRVVA